MNTSFVLSSNCLLRFDLKITRTMTRTYSFYIFTNYLKFFLSIILLSALYVSVNVLGSFAPTPNYFIKLSSI